MLNALKIKWLQLINAIVSQDPIESMANALNALKTAFLTKEQDFANAKKVLYYREGDALEAIPASEITKFAQLMGDVFAWVDMWEIAKISVF